MDSRHFFNSEKYFRELCESNILAAERGFTFCTCSGVSALQGMLENFRTSKAFFCLDDTNDGNLFRGKGGGWFKKRTFTVFIMHFFDYNDMSSYSTALALCRELFSQVIARMIVDADDISNELVYLHTENVLCRELGKYSLNGCTGLYFMIDVSEPVNLTFDKRLWKSKA